jgi:hypothetical protein
MRIKSGKAIAALVAMALSFLVASASAEPVREQPMSPEGQAQSSQRAACISHQRVESILKEDYQEILIFKAATAQVGVLHVYVSPNGQTWTIVRVHDGVACPVVAGQGFKTLEPTPPAPLPENTPLLLTGTCGYYDHLLYALHKSYKEVRVAVALSRSTLVTITASDEAWSIITTDRLTGRSCVRDSGEKFEHVQDLIVGQHI